MEAMNRKLEKLNKENYWRNKMNNYKQFDLPWERIDEMVATTNKTIV
jgi:hypothetical protein